MSGSFPRGLRPEVSVFLPLPTHLRILWAQLIEMHMLQNVVHISSFKYICGSTNLFPSMMPRGIQIAGWHYINHLLSKKTRLCHTAKFYSSAYSCPNPIFIPIVPSTLCFLLLFPHFPFTSVTLVLQELSDHVLKSKRFPPTDCCKKLIEREQFVSHCLKTSKVISFVMNKQLPEGIWSQLKSPPRVFKLNEYPQPRKAENHNFLLPLYLALSH